MLICSILPSFVEMQQVAEQQKITLLRDLEFRVYNLTRSRTGRAVNAKPHWKGGAHLKST